MYGIPPHYAGNNNNSNILQHHFSKDQPSPDMSFWGDEAVFPQGVMFLPVETVDGGQFIDAAVLIDTRKSVQQDSSNLAVLKLINRL